MADPGYPPPPYQPPQGSYPSAPPQAYPPPQEGYQAKVYQAGYPPSQQAPAPPVQTTTTVVAQPVVVSQPIFGELPVTITDSRGQRVQTITEHRSGLLTWLICAFVCLLTGCCCLALIPFCINGTKDVYHISPTDGAVVGVYKRI